MFTLLDTSLQGGEDVVPASERDDVGRLSAAVRLCVSGGHAHLNQRQHLSGDLSLPTFTHTR